MDDKFVKFCSVCNETRQNMDWCNDEKFKEFSKGYHFVYVPKGDMEICPSCKQGKLVDSPLNFDEFRLIDDVSGSDRKFLEAMIKLKQIDIIEFQLKIQQFKTQLQQQEQVKKEQEQKSSAKDTIKCPKCGSTNIQLVKRKWTPIMGFMTNKVDRVCVNCKHKF